MKIGCLCVFAFVVTFAIHAATFDSEKSKKLSPNVETTLVDNFIYYINSTGEYTVTTGGKAVVTSIEIRTGSAVTLVLNNCHICTTNDVVTQSSMPYYGAPLVFTLSAGNLKLQFKGENSLTCSKADPTNRFMGAITLKPIANDRTIDVTIESLEEDASLSLYGRNVDNTVAYGPIYLPTSYTLNENTYYEKTYSVESSVTLQSGKIHLYTTDLLGKPYLSPAITAKKVSLAGADVTLTNVPYNTNEFTSVTTTWEDVINYCTEQSKSPLFDCTTFAMTGGRLSTQGDRWPVLKEKINEHTESNYGTTYGYPSELFILPGEPTGGVVVKQASTTFYGFNLALTENLAACFTNITSETKITLLGGVVEVGVANAEAIFADASVDIHQATAASNIFDVALIPTSEGFVLEDYDFGILKIGPSATDTIELVVALDLPEVAADVTVKTKTFTLEILCDGESIYRDEVTLERQSETTRFMCTVTTGEPFQSTTAGTRKYTIRAICE